MKKILFIFFVMIISTTLAWSNDAYVVIHKYPDGGLLQINRKSIESCYGYVSKDMTLYPSGSGSNRSYSFYEEVLNSAPASLKLATVKNRGENIKIAIKCDWFVNEYALLDIKTNIIMPFTKITPNSSVYMIKKYLCTLKGQRALKKLEEGMIAK